MVSLDEARERIRSLDDQLIALIADRVAAARLAGEAKREAHQPLRDYTTEREVVARLRAGFEARDLDPQLGEQLARVLILEALRVQEEDGLVPADGPQGTALIVGGAGRMGRWFAHFMNAIGYEVAIADPSGPVDGFGHVAHAHEGARHADVVVVATPPQATSRMLKEVADSGALVFDIASLKAPVADTLRGLASDANVTSVHPLWGPATRVLSGKNLLVLDCGNAQAADAASRLFGQTAAHVHRLSLDEHDPLIAYTLGLPHLLNLAYAEVLSASGRDFKLLAELGGPTFVKQNQVAAEVASEDPELYRQIQALDAQAGETHARLHAALEAIAQRVQEPADFRAAMLEYRSFFGEAAREVGP